MYLFIAYLKFATDYVLKYEDGKKLKDIAGSRIERLMHRKVRQGLLLFTLIDIYGCTLLV